MRRNLSVAFWLLAAGGLAAADLEEFRIKREPVFAFVQKPRMTKAGDQVTIAFESKGLCDVTVAIEDAQGRITRHLACGVLGANAPEPFQQNTTKQTIVWDGKDDQGRYVDDKSTCLVRVSLGLKPQFEKNLFWDPRKRAAFAIPRAGDAASKAAPIMVAAPEGVYVFDSGSDVDHLRLFDHEGAYVRTLYPFPADKLDQVLGLKRFVFPQSGRELPFKNFFYGTTLLTSGVGEWRGLYGLHPSVRDAGFSASAMAAQDRRIALACVSLNRLATDGSSGGLPLPGPKTALDATLDEGTARGSKTVVYPRSAALSPDGKQLYLTGYTYPGGRSSHDQRWLHGVMRVAYENGDRTELFLGRQGAEESGSDDAHFNVPSCVACDKQGRLYVGDYMNDRIQVYAPDGKLLKSVKVEKPGQIVIHQRTQEIYVFSWFLMNQKLFQVKHSIKPWLIHLGPLSDPTERARYPLPLLGYSEQAHMDWTGLQYRFELDTWTEPPTAWLVPGGMTAGLSFDKVGIQLFAPAQGKLVLKRDFGEEARRAVVRTRPGSEYRQRLYVNPRTPNQLYVGEGDTRVRKDFSTLLQIDVATGKAKEIVLPFPAEDACFDLNGHAYLRTVGEVVRFDSLNWREIPWDYGEARPSLGSQAAILMPSTRNWHHGGMAVSAKGHLAVACYYTRDVAALKSEPVVAASVGNPYQPAIYPGRAVGAAHALIHIWDMHGKLLYEDALPGLGAADGVGLDAHDGLYVASGFVRNLQGGKPYFDYMTGTLIKVRPKVARIVSASERVPVPLAEQARPSEPQPVQGAWIEGAEWLYGGIGFAGLNAKHEASACACWNYRCAFDYFGRSFAPEIQHGSVAVLDSNGNLIVRIGQYGNVDDGQPLDPVGRSPSARSMGGDETALFYPAYLATSTDKRLFISDAGNACIRSVMLGYQTEEKAALTEAPEPPDHPPSKVTPSK